MKSLQPEFLATESPNRHPWNRSRRTNLLALNDDVLCMLMAELSRPDVSSLMRASPVLYNLGIPTLLKGTIALKTEMMIYSFSRFMLAKSSRARSPHLRRLEMSTPYLSDESEQIVSVIRESAAAILEQATHLESLIFWRCHPLIDVDNPSVIRALASITTLRYLDFHNPEKAQKGIEEAFQDISSPISELVIQDFQEEKIWNSFPQNLLASVEGSLTKLALSVDPAFLSSMLFQLPHVEELCLHFTHPFSLESLPRAFPNVKRLTLDAFYAGNKLTGPEVQELVFRNRNSSHKWSSLDYIRGDTKSLLSFGPTCTAREVRVDYLDPRLIDSLCQFLPTAKPSVLHIDIWLESTEDDIPLLFHSISTHGRLNKLVLSFYFASEPMNSSRVSDIWELLLQFLYGSSITTLRLKVGVYMSDGILDSVPYFQEAFARDRMVEITEKMPRIQRLLITTWWRSVGMVPRHWHFYRGRQDKLEEVDTEVMKVYRNEIKGPIWGPSNR